METLIGIAVMAICWMLYVLYIGFLKLCDEDSKRGEIARKIGNISGGIFLVYMIVCSFVIPLIVFIIWLCT